MQSPSVTFICRWKSSSRRTFRHSRPFSFARTYSITNAKTATEAKKHFMTGRLAVHAIQKHSAFVISSTLWSFASLLPIMWKTKMAGSQLTWIWSSPKVNDFQGSMHSCNCVDTFCWHIKTPYFQQAFSSPRHLPPCSSDLVSADIVGTYKFHLLTFLLCNWLTQ